MPKPEKQTVACPRCGETIEFTLRHSINTDMPDVIHSASIRIGHWLFFLSRRTCFNKT